jgi:hypothetical protein
MTTHIKNLKQIRDMNKQNMFSIVTIVSLTIALCATISLMQKVNAIYEDQLEVCNFKGECTQIDIDDFMTKEKSDHLWSIFNNDIDTYDIKDMTVTPLK